jgi:SAM-dependent methyltransferase
MKTNKPKKSYIGTRARLYEKKRKNKRTWKKEQIIIFKFLEKISRIHNKNLTVLDIPVGTGRFFKFYKKLDFLVTGIDISEDMLEQAEKKLWNESDIHPIFKENFAKPEFIKDISQYFNEEFKTDEILFPGIPEGIQSAKFTEAALANAASDEKWTALKEDT